MEKIPTIFKRDNVNLRLVTKEENPVCQWVFNGEWIATRKYDGTCVKIEDGKYFKRREVKAGKRLPDGFIIVDCDDITGKRVGWIQVDESDPENKWHMRALTDDLEDGTYELLGPRINGNPENKDIHCLQRHTAADVYHDAPRTFEGIHEWFKGKDIEGLVFHHPNGSMAKIKKRDFGLKRSD